MRYISRSCLAMALLWPLASSALDAPSGTSSPVAGWIAQGVAENLARAPQEALASCRRAFEHDIASHPRSIEGMPPAGDFVLYLTSSPGWGGYHVLALAIGRRGGTLLYSHGDRPLASPVSAKAAAGIQRTLQDMRPYRYAYAPGVMDGECGLVVMQLQGVRTIAVLPPGARMDGDRGDPLNAFLRWAEPRWPKAGEDG